MKFHSERGKLVDSTVQNILEFMGEQDDHDAMLVDGRLPAESGQISFGASKHNFSDPEMSAIMKAGVRAESLSSSIQMPNVDFKVRGLFDTPADQVSVAGSILSLPQ